ncbi:MAG: hypothetical protein WC222_00230 [Parachlamydiales bacterium]
MISYISSLYARDDRFGDFLIEPQRYYQNRITTLADFKPEDSLSNRIERILDIVISILPTIGAYICGAIGAIIKSFSGVNITRPPSVVDPQSVFNALENPDTQIVVVPPLSEHLWSPNPPPEDGSCIFSKENIFDDIFIHIGSYLSLGDLATLQCVSKDFKVMFRAPPLWSKYLEDPNVRIWGALQWRFQRNIDNGRFEYVCSSETQEFEHDPYGQLVAFDEVRNNNYEELVYIARLMKGGPIAFLKIPVIDSLPSIEELDAHMNTPVVRGTTTEGVTFLAMRIIQTDVENAVPTLLVFTRPIAQIWLNEKNSLWEKGQLKFSDDRVLGYVKDIIGRENLAFSTEFYRINRSIKLCEA